MQITPSFRSSCGNSEPSNMVRRLAGLSGVAGALLFFVGDMLFYGHFGSGEAFPELMRATVMSESPNRLVAGGLVGPVAACLCIVGFWHVYLNTSPSGLFLRRLIFALFAALMVYGSAVHTLWTAKGLTMKYCYDPSASCSELAGAIKSYWELVYTLGAVPGYIAALLLLALVILGKTYYPRWTALLNPALLIGILTPVSVRVSSPLGAILVGGLANLSITIFFIGSLVTTWTIPDRKTSRSS